jgi:hypothetical protein
VEVCVEMFRFGFATVWANQPEVLLTALLQALKQVKLSIGSSIAMFIVPVPVFSVVMYVLDRDAPEKLMLSYVARDVWAVIFVVVIVLWKLRFLFSSQDPELVAETTEPALREGLVDSGEGTERLTRDVGSPVVHEDAIGRAVLEEEAQRVAPDTDFVGLEGSD